MLDNLPIVTDRAILQPISVDYAADRLNLPSQKVAESVGGKIFSNFTRTKANGQILNLLEYRFYPPSDR
jgi:hypothetical protein